MTPSSLYSKNNNRLTVITVIIIVLFSMVLTSREGCVLGCSCRYPPRCCYRRHFPTCHCSQRVPAWAVTLTTANPPDSWEIQPAAKVDGFTAISSLRSWIYHPILRENFWKDSNTPRKPEYLQPFCHSVANPSYLLPRASTGMQSPEQATGKQVSC